MTSSSPKPVYGRAGQRGPAKEEGDRIAKNNATEQLGRYEPRWERSADRECADERVKAS